MVIVGAVVMFALLPFLAYRMADGRGRDPTIWAVMTLVFGPIVILILLLRGHRISGGSGF